MSELDARIADASERLALMIDLRTEQALLEIRGMAQAARRQIGQRIRRAMPGASTQSPRSAD